MLFGFLGYLLFLLETGLNLFEFGWGVGLLLIFERTVGRTKFHELIGLAEESLKLDVDLAV